MRAARRPLSAALACLGGRPGRAGPSASCSSASGGPKSVAVVTGASRGLGLEFVRQLLTREGQTVVATCRNPDGAKDLHALHDESPESLRIVRMDVTDEKSIKDAAAHVAQDVSAVSRLFNVAGILHIPTVLSPETALARVTAFNLMTNFQINALGPILVSKAFAPLLYEGGSASMPAVIANLSARVGSIADNSIGGWYSYRASKSAQNQLTKTLAVELARRRRNVAVVALHPGTCDTDLSLPFQKNVQPGKLFTRERAVQQLLEIIDGVTLADNGRFIAWDGQDIPF